MQKAWTVVITVVNAAAVPVLAFIIRMALGETRNPQEEVISQFLISTYRKYSNRTRST